MLYQDIFNGFQNVAVSFIAEFSFRLNLLFGIKQLLTVKCVVYYVMTKMSAND